MGRCFFLVILAVVGVLSNAAHAQSLKAKPAPVVVITNKESKRPAKSKQNVKYRIALIRDSSDVAVRIAHASELPRFRSIQLRYVGLAGKKTINFRRDSILGAIRAKQRDVIDAFNSGDENVSPQYKASYKRSLDHYLNGRNGGDVMKYQWHGLTSSRLPDEHEKLKVTIKTGLLKREIYSTDTLPAAELLHLPELDQHFCEPLDRFYMRRQLNGWGIEKARYQKFMLPNRKIIRKSFELYFEKNSSVPSDEDLLPIREYLRNNNMSVLHVSIEGLASVEGDSLLNLALQKKRAQQMIVLLQQYNQEPIGSDTVVMGEAWAAFRNAIRHTPFKWLDTLTDATIRKKINSDPSLAYAVEPYMKPLRKATLSITLSARLSREDIILNVRQEMQKLCPAARGLQSRMSAENESKMLGIYEYIERMIRIGHTDYQELAKLTDECTCAAEARVLLFYHMIKSRGNAFASPSASNEVASLDSLFADRNWNNIFAVAQQNILKLIATSVGEEKHRRLRQAVDIQYYMMKYIELGKLNPEVLCAIRYPDEKIFYGLKLNYYAMRYELSRTSYLPCVGNTDASVTLVRPVSNKADEWQKFIQTNTNRDPRSGFANRAPVFSMSPKSDYYYFLRTLFVKGDQSIRDYVFSSDNLAEFDLYHLAQVNVTNWDPLLNHFYDSAVGIREMDRLIRKLKVVDKRICKEQIHQLYLDYHVKALLYLNEGNLRFDKALVRIGGESLEYISEYYRRRADLLFPRLTIYLVDGLSSFYHLPTAKPSPWYAARIMHALSKRTILSEEEGTRWTKLKQFLQ